MSPKKFKTRSVARERHATYLKKAQEFLMTLAADVVKTVFEDAAARAGIELGMTPASLTRIALRFGWVFKSFSEGMTFGAGFKAGRLRFDYGYGSAREMRGLQNISLGYEF